MPLAATGLGVGEVARRAGVPVFCAAFHYPSKQILLDQLVHPGDDYEADMVRIREIYRPHMGKNRDTL